MAKGVKNMGVQRIESISVIVGTLLACLATYTGVVNAMTDVKNRVDNLESAMVEVKRDVEQVNAVATDIAQINTKMESDSLRKEELKIDLGNLSYAIGALDITLARIDERLKTLERSTD